MGGFLHLRVHWVRHAEGFERGLYGFAMESSSCVAFQEVLVL